VSLRYDAQADRLSRTANLPSISAFTAMAWAYRVGAGATSYNSVFAFGTASGVYSLYLRTGGAAVFGVTEWASDYTGSAIADGTWYHVAMTVAGTGAGQLLGYLNGAVNATGAGNSGLTAGTLWAGGHGAAGDNEWSNIRLAGLKIYDAVLTAAEILQEMRQLAPVRTTNLNVWSPAVDASAVNAAKDFSGNARDWTVGGTLAVEDGPPVPWRQGRRRFIRVPAAAGGSVLTQYYYRLLAGGMA
jgi:hypothetical protein